MFLKPSTSKARALKQCHSSNCLGASWNAVCACTISVAITDSTCRMLPSGN